MQLGLDFIVIEKDMQISAPNDPIIEKSIWNYQGANQGSKGRDMVRYKPNNQSGNSCTYILLLSTNCVIELKIYSIWNQT